jgi:hypothetical protein
MLTQPLTRRGYADPQSRQQIAKWVEEGWEDVTSTIIMRCFIRCGLVRKCDYPAHVRAAHGLDQVKVSLVIAGLIMDESQISAEHTIFMPNDEAPPPDEEA